MEIGKSDEHTAILTQNVVGMKFLDNNLQKQIYFDLNEATLQIISKVNSLKRAELARFHKSDSDFFFLNYNVLNSFYEFQRKSSSYFVEELAAWSDNKTAVMQTLLALSFMVIFLGLMILIPFYISITNAKKQVLTIFLDIPLKRVRGLFQKCENFLNSL